jgi:hypothetical protein
MMYKVGKFCSLIKISSLHGCHMYYNLILSIFVLICMSQKRKSRVFLVHMNISLIYFWISLFHCLGENVYPILSANESYTGLELCCTIISILDLNHRFSSF